MATLREHLAVTPRRSLLAIGRARGVRLSWEAPKATLLAACPASPRLVEFGLVHQQWTGSTPIAA